MKKKALYLICIVVVLLICSIAYFRPMSLADTVGEHTQFDMILNEFGIKDGKPDTKTAEYSDITEKQNSAVLSLLDKYTYTRTFATPVSDGTIHDIGARMLSLHAFDENASVNTVIVVTDSGKITVNDKNYHMNKAHQFIEEIAAVMERAGEQ